jgi:hypothetical protein
MAPRQFESGWRLIPAPHDSWETFGAGATGAVKRTWVGESSKKYPTSPFAGLDDKRNKKTPHKAGLENLDIILSEK